MKSASSPVQNVPRPKVIYAHLSIGWPRTPAWFCCCYKWLFYRYFTISDQGHFYQCPSLMWHVRFLPLIRCKDFTTVTANAPHLSTRVSCPGGLETIGADWGTTSSAQSHPWLQRVSHTKKVCAASWQVQGDTGSVQRTSISPGKRSFRQSH